MPTVEEIAQEVISAISVEKNLPLACKWVDQRYRELCGYVQFRHARKYGQIYLPAPVNAGTVTITQDSNVLTFDATAAAAIIAYNTTITSPAYPLETGSDAMRGLYFRAYLGRTWYRIAECTSNGFTVTLEVPFASDNGSFFQTGTVVTDNAYYIVPRYITAPSDARRFGTFVCDYLYRPLKVLSQNEMDMYWSSRFWVTAYPQYISVLGEDETETGQPFKLEIYPYPTSSVAIHFTYWEHPRILKPKTPIPKVIDPDILREGAMIDAMRKKMAEAMDKGNVEAAALWRNEYRSQETKFMGLRGRAAHNDRGMDDIRFIVARRGGPGGRPLDWDPVQTAYENYIARGF